ncbi:MAG: hypothetical protein D3924_02895 [Candidatus Electrothrix sp. AR4]|nr:hypothetical protein [Candidatus Electrothrix sp. AR4]
MRISVFSAHHHKQEPDVKIALFSFGFKHGHPEADMVLDVRFLPNPYWDLHLRNHTGVEKPVAAYVLNNEIGRQFLLYLEPLVAFTVNSHKEAGRKELHYAVGCTGGRHRSVAVTEHLRHFLSDCIDSGDDFTVYHRDIEKK